MKSIIASIKENWCNHIVAGVKRWEIRKTKPNVDGAFKVYIYQSGKRTLLKTVYGNSIPTNKNGTVIGHFICDRVLKIINQGSRFFVEGETDAFTNKVANESRLDFSQMKEYAAGKKILYAWHITDLFVYDHPKELNGFISCKFICDCVLGEPDAIASRRCIVDCKAKSIVRPPQSWCYAKELFVREVNHDL